MTPSLQRETIQIPAGFSQISWKPRKKWHSITQVLKEMNCQPRTLETAKIPFRIEEKMKTFSDERKLREFVASRSTLEKWLEETLHRKKRIKEGILEHKDRRKSMVSKNMGEYNRLFF